MTLSDLHNPRNIECLFHLRRQVWIELSDNQGWQEHHGSVELWEAVAGRLLRVRRWLKRSVIIFTPEDRAR